MLLVEYLCWAVAPSAVAWTVLHVPAAARLLREEVARHRPPTPAQPPIERLAADLRRIASRLDAVAGAERMPGRALRLASISAAYDDTLLDACRALEVPLPRPRAPLSAAQRLQVEADLAGAGLRW